ncbi:MAG: dipeptide ABC transporter ATP-binding protein [Pseudomonadota bacterium]
MTATVLEAADLTRHYLLGGGWLGKDRTLKAVDGVSFSLTTGETMAIVGESGCGKSTLARLCTLIEQPTAGSLRLHDQDTVGLGGSALKAVRRDVQMIFQNPYGSLNPRQTIGTILEEPLLVNTKMAAAERRARALAMLEKVGLRPEHYQRYPHMFSGGQRQRIAIGRALMLEPKIVVADEPVSALDVSIQAQVLNLMLDLQEELGLAYLFISHDLSVVRLLARRVMVMYLGRAVEQGDATRIFERPLHPYTKALLAATPAVDPDARRRRIALSGELPSPLAPPPGCPFHRRCPIAREDCSRNVPTLRTVDGREVACHYAEDALAHS